VSARQRAVAAIPKTVAGFMTDLLIDIYLNASKRLAKSANL
jgi:hypothetical protein